MAPRPVLEVRGARELRTSLRRAGEDLGDFKDANRQVAQLVAQRGQGQAPRRRGILAASVRAGATQTQAIVRAGSARVPYAGVIHWGWPRRHIVAQPWLSEAATETQPAWLVLYQSAIERILDRVKGT